MLQRMYRGLQRRLPILNSIKAIAETSSLYNLRRSVIDLNHIDELKKIYGWSLDPELRDPTLFNFDYPEDANQRRIRDAESLGSVVRNTDPKICLDIGTSTGHSAALMAINAPQAKIFTVNIPPEEIIAGEGGKFTTIALEREKIGAYYRQLNLVNITQILANTAKWEPDFSPINIAFIDGSHDTKFVYNDSRKALACMKPGAFLLWHDFNLELATKFDWIYSVCLGVEKLYRAGLLTGRIYHLRDSWIGIYQVPNR